MPYPFYRTLHSNVTGHMYILQQNCFQIYLIIKITWGYRENFSLQPLPVLTELEFHGQGFIFYDSGSLSVVSRPAASASPGNCSKCKLARSTPDLMSPSCHMTVMVTPLVILKGLFWKNEAVHMPCLAHNRHSISSSYGYFLIGF